MRGVLEKLLTSKSSEVVLGMLHWLELIHCVSNLPILNSMPEVLPRLLLAIQSRPSAQPNAKGAEI